MALALGLASGGWIGQAVQAAPAAVLPAALVAAVLAMMGLVLAWPFVRSGRAPDRSGVRAVATTAGGEPPAVAGPDVSAATTGIAGAVPVGADEGPWLLHEGGTLDERLAHSLAFRARDPGHGLALVALSATLEADAGASWTAAQLRGLVRRLRAVLWPGDALAVGASPGAACEVLVLVDRPGGETPMRQAVEALWRVAATPAPQPDEGPAVQRLRVGVVTGEHCAERPQAVIDDALRTLRAAAEDPDPGPVLRWFDAAQAERRRRGEEARGLIDQAVAAGRIELVFEPVCRLADGGLEGAFVRLGGLEPPLFDADLAPALQPVLTTHAMRLALARLAQWRRRPGTQAPRWVGVRVPGAWLDDVTWSQTCQQQLAAHGLVASDLRLLLEEADVADDATRVARLKPLCEQGLGLVLVGLGSCSPSLSYLTRLPVQAVTLAPEVHGGWPAQDSGQVRVGGIVGLARSLGMAVIAEGLVDRAQCQVLQGLGVALGLGPVLGAAMSGDESGRSGPGGAQDTM